MRLLVESLADNASVNIADRLRDLVDWEELGLFQGRRVLAHEDLRLITIEDIHITYENLDQHLPPSLTDPEVVIFLSRHKAESGTPSLTAHPIGNFDEARYGGQEGTVVPTHPSIMAGLLSYLDTHAPSGYEVTLEATHHGPYLPLPTIFLELGSSEDQWGDQEAAQVLAEAVLADGRADAPSVLWVGGGHYCPQVTDLVLDGQLTAGHIIPNWAADQEISDETLEQTVQAIPGCQGYVLQRGATSAERKLAERLENLGIPAFER